MKHLTIAMLTALLFFSGCATTEDRDANDWRFTEPESTEEDESVNAVAEVDPEDETPVLADLDCSQLDLDHWAPEEFPFVLYRYFACTREAEENIVFSPAALRIALAENTQDIDGIEGQAIAELLGYFDINQFSGEAQSYRDELLERRPGPSEVKMGQGFWEYWIEEDDPAKLLEAMGIEFFSAPCEYSDDNCRWDAQNDRWSETFLDDEQPADLEDIGHPLTRAMILRGQWESNTSYPDSYVMEGQRSTLDFQVSKSEIVTSEFLSYRVDGEAHTNIASIFEARLVGGEISMIIIASWNYSLSQLEAQLSADQVHSWISSLHRVGPRSGPVLNLPDFDLRETVDIANPLHLEHRLENTTRLAIDDQGINFPDPVELNTDFGGGGTLDYIEYDIFTLNHPFLFMVYDHPTESIVLMGRIARP